ncbi:hypothetical protein, partial [Phascolarctobacterium succinatutens]|uniref:hypothetical protein n=1 Tax=Phascolarctobacterium succinatutens TaxID=626940 RepID=UPI0026EA7539
THISLQNNKPEKNTTNIIYRFSLNVKHFYKKSWYKNKENAVFCIFVRKSSLAAQLTWFSPPHSPAGGFAPKLLLPTTTPLA